MKALNLSQISRKRSRIQRSLTVPVVCGSAPIQGGSSSNTDVLFDSFVAVSMSVEDVQKTNVPKSQRYKDSGCW